MEITASGYSESHYLVDGLILEANHESWPLDRWVRVACTPVYEPGGSAAKAADEYAALYGREWVFRVNRATPCECCQ